jgi:hypothetical protein
MDKRSVKTDIALALVFGLAAFVGCLEIVKYVSKDYQLYQKESECVRHYQMKNYSRNEIVTGNGKCWIRGVDQ